MSTETVAVSLSTLAGGRLEERFQLALGETLENIRDPNTSKDVVRKITITLEFKPQEDRQFALCKFEVGTKPAKTTPVHSFLDISKQDGVLIATEHQRKPERQLPLPDNVQPITPAKKEETR